MDHALVMGILQCRSYLFDSSDYYVERNASVSGVLIAERTVRGIFHDNKSGIVGCSDAKVEDFDDVGVLQEDGAAQFVNEIVNLLLFGQFDCRGSSFVYFLAEIDAGKAAFTKGRTTL